MGYRCTTRKPAPRVASRVRRPAAYAAGGVFRIGTNTGSESDCHERRDRGGRRSKGLQLLQGPRTLPAWCAVGPAAPGGRGWLKDRCTRTTGRARTWTRREAAGAGAWRGCAVIGWLACVIPGEKKTTCVATGENAGIPVRHDAAGATSLCLSHQFRAFPAATKLAEQKLLEGDDEWTTGPGLHSCRDPCGAAHPAHRPNGVHAASQQCGAVLTAGAEKATRG